MKYLPPLHLAASEDELRPALRHIQILDGIATATNGHVLARLNMSEYSKMEEHTLKRLSGYYIHADVWKLIHDADNMEFEEGVLTYWKGGIEAKITLSSEIEFPAYDDIMKAVANSQFDSRSFMGINPSFMELEKRLFKTTSLIVRFYKGHSMMVFFPADNAKGFIGIMPTAIDQQDAVIDFSLT